MSEHVRVDLELMGKPIRLACRPEDRETLLAAARRLNSVIDEVRGRGVVGSDRIAALAALDLTHDLLRCEGRLAAIDTIVSERLSALGDSLEFLLNKPEPKAL